LESVTRTVRFKKQELKTIEQFLVENPIFDFSTLVRTALSSFIENPQINLTAVKSTVSARKDGKRGQ